MLAASLVVLASMVATASAQASELRFRGQAIVPSGTTFEGTTVGGLSSITYDAKRRVYYAISDDQAQPVRFYTVALDIRDGRLSDGDVSFEGVTTIPFAPFSVEAFSKSISSQLPCPTSPIAIRPVLRSNENRHGLRRPTEAIVA